MALIDTVGVLFSKLKENHEKAPILFRRSGQNQQAQFDCYGFLPGGGRYGVAKTGVWFDPGYYEHCVVLVGPDGVCKAMTLLKKHYFSGFPDAMAASPSGRRIIWKIGGEVYNWNGSAPDMPAIQVNRYLPEKAAITDAVMREDGLLEMLCSDGISRRYLCDADALLVLTGGRWVAYCSDDSCHGLNYCLQEIMYQDPLVNTLILREGIERAEPTVFSGCGLHEVTLSQSLQSIGLQSFADNPALERIVIPVGVASVESEAFQGCTSLHDLVIEGDPVRTLLWAEDAFSGCPCEETYLQIRASARKIGH